MPTMNEVKVLEFSDIIKQSPFGQEKKITTFADLDGVFIKYGKESNFKSNFNRLNALRKVIQESEKFTFWSSRFNISEESTFWEFIGPFFKEGNISRFPFMTESSVERLEKFAKNANPNCEVTSKIGFKKVGSLLGLNDSFTRIALETLENNDKKMVVFGSSVVDRRRINQVAEKVKERRLNLNNLYYFDTGHLLF